MSDTFYLKQTRRSSRVQIKSQDRWVSEMNLVNQWASISITSNSDGDDESAFYFSIHILRLEWFVVTTSASQGLMLIRRGEKKISFEIILIRMKTSGRYLSFFVVLHRNFSARKQPIQANKRNLWCFSTYEL